MPVYSWDVRWLLWVNQSKHNVFLDWVLPPIAQYGYWYWLLLLVVILFLDHTRGKLVWLMGVIAWGFSSYVGDTLLNPLIKHPHPSAVPALASQIRLLAPVPSSFSFPSSAATISFAVAGVIIYFYSGWKRMAAFLTAGLVGYSRVYAGVHFPSGVIGGMIIGLAAGLGGTALAGRWWRSENAPPRKVSGKIARSQSQTE